VVVVVTIAAILFLCLCFVLLFLLEKLAIQVLLECARREPCGVAFHDELRQRVQQHGVRCGSQKTT
jgi:hypothetical protein